MLDDLETAAVLLLGVVGAVRYWFHVLVEEFRASRLGRFWAREPELPLIELPEGETLPSPSPMRLFWLCWLRWLLGVVGFVPMGASLSISLEDGA